MVRKDVSQSNQREGEESSQSRVTYRMTSLVFKKIFAGHLYMGKRESHMFLLSFIVRYGNERGRL